MRQGLERSWVRILDSTAWRRALRSSAVRDVRDTAIFEAADLARRRLLSRFHARRERERYDGVRTLCLQIGHTKSGGSLVGAMLDAHPNAVFADEVDVLAYLSHGFTPRQIFHLLEKGARREAMKGRVTARRLEPYSLAVPNQWQGRSKALRVMGDSRAGIATQRLGARPSLIDELQEQLGDVELRFLHVVRNPFDPMSAMMIRGKRTAEGAMERYFANCAILADLHDRLPVGMVHVVRYEDVVAEPRREVGRACEFLGLETNERYLEDCASIVTNRPPERTLVDWDAPSIERVTHEMTRYPFLDGYAFEHAPHA